MMNRRNFIKSCAITAASPALLRCTANQNPLDTYAGNTLVKGNKTGFFHVEKLDGKWWLITPEGNSFLTFGINHISPGLLKRKENRDFWWKELGITEPDNEAHFLQKLEPKIHKDMEAFGFNTFGCHSHVDILSEKIYPYVKQILFSPICHYRDIKEQDFQDVFSPDFTNYCDQLAKETCIPLKNDPYLIGYKFANCPVLREDESDAREVVTYGAARGETPTWPRVLRNLGPKAEGKQAYVDFMQKQYEDSIEKFNSTYSTTFSSFQQLLETPNWRKKADRGNLKEIADLDAFLLVVLEKFYQITFAAIRKYDSNHMIFGDKINGNTHTPVEIVQLIANHADLIYYQWYAFYEDQKPLMDKWSEATGKALYNADSAFSTPEKMMPHPNGPHLPTQEERAKTSMEFAQNAFSRPDFVGWDHCGWVDSWNTVPQQKSRQHSGLQDPFGNYHVPMQKALKQISREKYHWKMGS